MSPLGRRDFLVGTAAITAPTQAACATTRSPIETRLDGRLMGNQAPGSNVSHGKETNYDSNYRA